MTLTTVLLVWSAGSMLLAPFIGRAIRARRSEGMVDSGERRALACSVKGYPKVCYRARAIRTSA